MAAQPDIVVAPRPVPAWRQKASSFWRWWMGELSQVMPERFAALRGTGRLPALALDGGEALLVEPRALAATEPRVPVEALDPTRARAAVRTLLEKAGETGGRARVCLAQHEALVRRVAMPAATEENLAQVLGFEMDRLTPFRADDVYYDYRVLSRDSGAGTLNVLLAVARRDVVDARVQALRGLGVSVQGVAVRDDPTTGGAALDLLPTEQRGERETARERILRRALVVLVVVLFIAALLWPVWRKRQAVIALLPQLGRAAAEAQATDALSKDLERQVADYNFLLGKKHGNAPALAYLEDLSRLLPDNTWVQQFDLKQTGRTREVQISGETPSSSRLIELLVQSQLLQNPQTRGTVTRGTQPGTERFMIAAEPKPRAAPDPQPLEAVAPPAATPAPTPATPPRAAAVPGTPPPVPAKVEPVPAPKIDTKGAAKPAPGK